MASTVRREKAAPEPPEHGPDLLRIRLWNIQGRDLRGAEKPEFTLTMRRRQKLHPQFDLEQEHQPMRLAFVAMFADDACQMQFFRFQPQPKFFLGLATGAGVGGLAGVHLQFAAARTPQTEIRLLRPSHQERLVPQVETVKQRGNFVGQEHLS